MDGSCLNFVIPFSQHNGMVEEQGPPSGLVFFGLAKSMLRTTALMPNSCSQESGSPVDELTNRHHREKFPDSN
jgi:hypothetical protein